MNDKTILKIENISKHFPGVKAVDNVSFDLRIGEVHCLLGENGAGKSTLIKMLSGAYKKDSGRIYFKGKEVDINNAHDARELKISTIYQEMNLVPTMSIVENLFLGEEVNKRHSKILNLKEMERRTQEVLNRLNISLDLKTPVKKLRTAQQQMVEIAKSLLYENEIIIMDEPTSSISDKDTQELFRIIKDLKAQGVAIIYISHRLQELKEIVDRVTVLRDGKYVDTVNMKDTTIEELISMMVGREITYTIRPGKIESKETVLEVKNFSWSNKVKDVSFSLRKGEIVGFAGLVGAGRSELMKCIFRAEKPIAGEIFVNGEKKVFRNTVGAVKNGISYLSEDRKREGLVLNMSIAHNTTLASLVSITNGLKMNLSKEKQVSKKTVDDLKIATTSIDKKAKFLSGGNQQKVVIGKWLLTDSDIFIFDEPTRGIDVGAKLEIYKIINNLSASGKSVIMVSSELSEILRMSHRILIMSNGILTGELSNTEDLTQEKIMKLMLEGF